MSKTKPEPLKGKVQKWSLPLHTDDWKTKKAWEIRTKNIEKDVRSAVEWLKEECVKEKFDTVHLVVLDRIIDEAFEDVMEKGEK